MTKESPPRSLYRMVADAIQAQILDGRLKPNDRLPSESELCQMHSVGRNTVRRALSELARIGVVRTIAGLGTFVEDSRLAKTAEYLFGFTHEMRLHGKLVASRVLDARLIPADPFLSRRLQVQLGAEVVFLYRVRLMEGEPVALERSHLPHHLCPGILEYDFSERSLYETLSSIYGRLPYHAEQEIEAALATPEVARLLDLAPPAVVLVFHRETRLAGGEVIEYVDSELRADRFRFYTNLRLHAVTDEYAFRRLPVPAMRK